MSGPRRYWLAHDCPECGSKDERYEHGGGSWGGARMGSSSWGHSFSCCSEACGQAFGAKHRELVKTEAGRSVLRQLWAKLQSQSDARLSGEPYPGYDAENQLRALGRYPVGSSAPGLSQRVADLRDKAGMPLDQARELALSEAGITSATDNQWFGDMMILQVLADSEHVNEQEREVLTRWMSASAPPGVAIPEGGRDGR